MSTSIQTNNSSQFNELFAEACENDNLTCTICLDPYKNPYILQKCLHVFCKTCIDALPKLECPKCKKPFEATHVKHDFDKQDRVERVRSQCLKSGQSQSTKTSTPNNSAIADSQPPQNIKIEDDNVNTKAPTAPNPVLQYQSEVASAQTRPQKLACIAKMIFASYEPNVRTHYSLEGITTPDQAIDAFQPILQNNHIESLVFSGCNLDIMTSQIIKILSESKSLDTLGFTNTKENQPCTISIDNLIRIVNAIKINRSLITLNLTGFTIRNDSFNNSKLETFRNSLMLAINVRGNRSIKGILLPFYSEGQKGYYFANKIEHQLNLNKQNDPTSHYKGTLQEMNDTKEGEKYEKLKKEALLYLEKGLSVHTKAPIEYKKSITILDLAIKLGDADLVFHLLTNENYRATVKLKTAGLRDSVSHVISALSEYENKNNKR